MSKKISGGQMARSLLGQLKKKVKKLKKKGKTPCLAILSASGDPSCASYVKQKAIAAAFIGAKLKHFKFRKETSYQEFAEKLNEVVINPRFSGVMIQKPLPVSLAQISLDLIVPPKKDVDGANPKSSFIPPVAMAVLKALDFIRTGKKIEKATMIRREFPSENLVNWLTHQSILLIGRGETGGGPIAKTFSERKIRFLIAHRETANLAQFSKKSDIIICCVGKRIIKKEMLKEGAILIGVGIRKNKEGRYEGDFEEKEIKDVVSFYTPTPGGIGPITVASLMENLVNAT